MRVCGSVHVCASTQTTFLSYGFWVMGWTRTAFHLYVPNALFVARSPPFLFRPRVFPRAVGCGARRGRACTLGVSFGPGRAPCALGVPSKSIDLASDHGIAFLPAEPSKAMETPQTSFFLFFPLLLYLLQVPHQPSKYMCTLTQPRYNSSRASSFSLCDNHEQCFCVFVSVRVWHRTQDPTTSIRNYCMYLVLLLYCRNTTDSGAINTILLCCAVCGRCVSKYQNRASSYFIKL